SCLNLQIGVVQRLTHALGKGHPPGCVDPSTKCGVNDDTDCASLVSELLDDDVAVIGNDSRHSSLRCDVFHQRIRSGGVTTVFGGQPIFTWTLSQLTAQRSDAMT